MDISIIVPVYNVEKHLSRCLESLINQEGDIDYEIICVNDASQDDSASILERYSMEYPQKIRIVNNSTNVGLGSSRDNGVLLAIGDYLMFVDSDDSVKCDYLMTYFNRMKENPCDVLVGGYIDVHGTKQKKQLIPSSEWSQLSFVSAWSKLYDRRFFISNGITFSNVRYAEDTYMSLSLFAKKPKMRFLDYAGYYYFYNPQSITHHNVYDKNYEKIMSGIFEDFFNRCDIDDFNEKEKQMLEYAYISHMLNILLIYNRGCGWQRMKQKYAFFMQDLKTKFPNYKNNPYVGLFKPKGQRIKVRIGVGGFGVAEKLHLSKILFWIAAH